MRLDTWQTISDYYIAFGANVAFETSVPAGHGQVCAGHGQVNDDVIGYRPQFDK